MVGCVLSPQYKDVIAKNKPAQDQLSNLPMAFSIVQQWWRAVQGMVAAKTSVCTALHHCSRAEAQGDLKGEYVITCYIYTEYQRFLVRDFPKNRSPLQTTLFLASEILIK